MLANSRLHLALFAVVAIAMADHPQTASAADTEIFSRNVAVGDLDLASAQGTSTLRSRIMVAARAVCGGSDTRDLAESVDSAACRADALRRALLAATRVAAQQHPGTPSVATSGMALRG